MTTPSKSPAVEITYDPGAKLFDITVNGIEVDKTPLSIIKGQDRSVTDHNAAEFGRKTLAPLFAAAYENIDVKKLHRTALEPVDKLNDLLANRTTEDTETLREEFRNAFLTFRRTLNDINQTVYAQLSQPEPTTPKTAPAHEPVF